MRTSLTLLPAIALTLSIGCATRARPDAYVATQPVTPPARTVTAFTGALSCMDELFVAHGKEGFKITGVGIPDRTGTVAAGTRDMLISAISQMNRRSLAFQYVDWEFSNPELQVLYQMARDGNQGFHDQRYRHPTLYIRGAVTQLDKPIASNAGGAVAGFYKGVSADASANQNTGSSVLSIDLNVGEVLNRQIIPGLTSNNSLVISRRSNGLSGSLSMNGLGTSFSFSKSRTEGLHAAVRTLVELAAIELLGKIAQVPYWNCLEIESTNPAAQREMQKWWEDLSEEEQLRFVQQALHLAGYLEGSATGEMDLATRDAIARFQVDRDLVVSGRPGFQVYASLLGDDRPLQAGPPSSFASKRKEPNPVADQIPVRAPVGIELSAETGDAGFAFLDPLRAIVRVTGNAWVSCYYSDGAEISRVFPNRFQLDAYVPAGDLVEVPDRGAPFEILLDQTDSAEEITCLASDRDLAKHLPDELQAGDLAPLPVASVDQLIAAYEAIDPTALSIARLPISIQAD